MSLVTSKEMLLEAQKGGYAVGAFNVENMEMVKAVIAAAEELRAPVMLQTTPSTIKYGTLETYVGIVRAEAIRALVPVALHLDHGSSFELAVRAVKEGYTSIMIDGSGLGFEENIDVTRRVVAVAEPNGIPVEAELGNVGAKEDDTDCVKRGICKVNFATELRAAYTDAVKELLREKPETFDPKAFGKVGIPAVKELVMGRMKVCGCNGKA